LKEAVTEEIQEETLADRIASRITRLPKGEDGLMLRQTLEEIEERFLGYDLLL
jgi:hypothetical protein